LGHLNLKPVSTAIKPTPALEYRASYCAEQPREPDNREGHCKRHDSSNKAERCSQSAWYWIDSGLRN